MILVSFQILGSSELVQNCYKFTPISRRILGDLHAVHADFTARQLRGQ
jgi:hypothetical protein